jgi:hypothetical protein
MFILESSDADLFPYSESRTKRRHCASVSEMGMVQILVEFIGGLWFVTITKKFGTGNSKKAKKNRASFEHEQKKPQNKKCGTIVLNLLETWPQKLMKASDIGYRVIITCSTNLYMNEIQTTTQESIVGFWTISQMTETCFVLDMSTRS